MKIIFKHYTTVIHSLMSIFFECRFCFYIISTEHIFYLYMYKKMDMIMGATDGDKGMFVEEQENGGYGGNTCGLFIPIR